MNEYVLQVSCEVLCSIAVQALGIRDLGALAWLIAPEITAIRVEMDGTPRSLSQKPMIPHEPVRSIRKDIERFGFDIKKK